MFLQRVRLTIILIGILALPMASERAGAQAQTQTMSTSQLETLGVSLRASLREFYGYLKVLSEKKCVDEAELSYVQARIAELDARERADSEAADQAYKIAGAGAAGAVRRASSNNEFILAVDALANSLKPCMTEAERQKVYDTSVARKLKVVFSAVPDVYCQTPEAVKAKQIIANEIKRVKDEIQYNSYNVKNLNGRPDSQAISAGKEAYVGALQRILAHLEDNYKQLDGLPPCATGYNPVFANGILLGIYVIKATGNTVITERFITSDRITNEFSNSHDPAGVGVNIAYAFTPWNNTAVVAPFISLDYLNNSVGKTIHLS